MVSSAVTSMDSVRPVSEWISVMVISVIGFVNEGSCVVWLDVIRIMSPSTNSAKFVARLD